MLRKGLKMDTKEFMRKNEEDRRGPRTGGADSTAPFSGSAQTKCFDCKNNARLGFKGVVPLCIATGSKEYADVVSCGYYERAEPNASSEPEPKQPKETR